MYVQYLLYIYANILRHVIANNLLVSDFGWCDDEMNICYFFVEKVTRNRVQCAKEKKNSEFAQCLNTSRLVFRIYAMCDECACVYDVRRIHVLMQ